MGTYGYPSAPETVERWAERAGCDVSMTTEEPPIDFDTGLPGAETTVSEYKYRCQNYYIYDKEDRSKKPDTP